jgi:hypothetical protein
MVREFVEGQMEKATGSVLAGDIDARTAVIELWIVQEFEARGDPRALTVEHSWS